MRNTKKLIALLLGVTLVLALFTACDSSKLAGTYYASGGNLFSGLQFTSITFSGNNRVSMSALGIVGTKGTYRISGNSIELKYNEPSFVGEGKAVVKTMSFERKGKTIYLDGYEFIKD